jgi:protein gp37
VGERTLISWCDHTFNPWVGCQKIGPSGQSACDGCYAAHMMDERFHRVSFGAPGKGAGTRSLTSAGYWRQPLKWDRAAQAAGTTPFVFGGSLMDPFDHHAPKEWRRRYFDEVIRPTPHLVWLLLTKRPHMIVDLAEDAGGLPPNVALGTTAENQAKWDERIGELVAAREALGALFAFASCEPMLGPINPRQARITASMRKHPAWSGSIAQTFDPIHSRQDPRFRLHWIITGGETDQGAHLARASHPGWFRRIRNACADTRTAYHHKQHGEWWESEPVFGVHEPFAIAYDGTLYKMKDLAYPDGARYGEAIRADHDKANLTAIYKVGATKSGRTLDGIIYDQRPEVRTV